MNDSNYETFYKVKNKQLNRMKVTLQIDNREIFLIHIITIIIQRSNETKLES